MSFLPEDDQEYLNHKGIKYELLSEQVADGGERRAIKIPEFTFASNLHSMKNGQLVPCASCDLLIVIPKGYATTKLDSFYTYPRLKRADGMDPAAATSESDLFGTKWHFWSRHLDDKDWRDGIDGLASYFNYVRRELHVA